jgi:predicted kinase
LHLVCGKIAAGKSTLANCLASAPATALISEDHWLSHLRPGEIALLEDHTRCSARLGEVKEDHV